MKRFFSSINLSSGQSSYNTPKGGLSEEQLIELILLAPSSHKSKNKLQINPDGSDPILP